MAKAWCVLKSGGQALIGVPTGDDLIQVRCPITHAMACRIARGSMDESTFNIQTLAPVDKLLIYT